MTVLATHTFGESAPGEEPKVVLAAGPRRARLRMVSALSAWSDLTTHSGPSVRNLLSWGAGARQLVVIYCEEVSPEQLELFKELKRETPRLLIVVVCEELDRRAVRRLVDNGIDGLVFADQLEAALAPTVAAVFARQLVMPRELRASVHKPSLSARERQILGMVVAGLTNHEIGTRMYLAESTVKSHLSSAYSKLGVRSRSEAVAMILDPQGSLATGILGLTPKAELRAA